MFWELNETLERMRIHGSQNVRILILQDDLNE